MWKTAWLTLMLGLISCSVVRPPQQAVALDKNTAWAVLPFSNHSETPQAGLRASSIVGGLLSHKGIAKLVPGKPAGGDSLLDSDAPALAASLEWAKNQGARYAVTGTVSEWRYKAGLEGEPAVGLTLQIVDTDSGQIVWSALGAKRGWGYESLSEVGLKLSEDLLASLRLQ